MDICLEETIDEGASERLANNWTDTRLSLKPLINKTIKSFFSKKKQTKKKQVNTAQTRQKLLLRGAISSERVNCHIRHTDTDTYTDGYTDIRMDKENCKNK